MAIHWCAAMPPDNQLWCTGELLVHSGPLNPSTKEYGVTGVTKTAICCVTLVTPKACC